ncbi:c-type cytochrome [Aequorivita sp. H23M31]|uniref:C-type cytochrome n=1 Tax=Aequorivita ciconiae TaxID=2494375 RepID=A0A410G0E0_9FLAO|nr:c-type cytochrome [Aequorivita sp. H23M31]QAA80747.1 c-type cytochrome [Aequorivita sp. H23M31]
MKLISYLSLILLLISCKSEKRINTVEVAPPERGELSMDSQIFLGNRLFSEKKCITCHDVNRVKKGPSVKEIVAVYKEKDGDIVSFLKGNSKPIVATDPEQIAIMQENIEGFLKNISDVEMNSIATYMMHVDELYGN